MDIDLLVDRYKTTKFSTRALLVFVIATFYPLLTWIEEGEILTEELEIAESETESKRQEYSEIKEKTARIPELEENLAKVENQLEEARKYLPRKVAMDEILKTLAEFEKKENVRLTQFTPEQEEPQPQTDYIEKPVQISLYAKFPRVMAFLDAIVHMKKIIHIRKIDMTKDIENADDGYINANVKLIIYRSR